MSAPADTLTDAEFNTRAVQAMRTVELQENSFDDDFMHTVSKLIDRGFVVSPRQQLTLYRVVDRHSGSIWDALITDYARQRIKETARTKRCADCKHWRWLPEFEVGYCRNPDLAPRSPMHSGLCRRVERLCGPDGKWWEATRQETT